MKFLKNIFRIQIDSILIVFIFVFNIYIFNIDRYFPNFYANINALLKNMCLDDSIKIYVFLITKYSNANQGKKIEFKKKYLMFIRFYFYAKINI